MNRNQFLRLSAMAGMGISIYPNLAFSSKLDSLKDEELYGKGNPELYGTNYLLRKEAFEAFLAMKTEASKSDLSLHIVSSYRSFEHQNRIWERKYKRYTKQGFSPEQSIKKIIEYSTIPGTSRHHWGTDIDLVDSSAKQPKNVLHPANFEENGVYNHLKIWMEQNAHLFGYYLVYTNASERKGFKYEPWHYSYRPLSCEFLREYRKLNIEEILKSEELMGNGSLNSDFLNNYFTENILDINPELL